jgi:BirA family transcriptional regulator, biotin operon repressor / biotin---[acetyl-CoA-carboxylase] ligase
LSVCLRVLTGHHYNDAISRRSTSRPAAGRAAHEGITDARLGRIIRVLSDHATVVLSGTRIGAEIGSSRSEVWRLVQRLRSLGVQIAGHQATGYRMEKVPDLLLPETLGPLLRGTIFAAQIHHFFQIGSTNVAAMHAAAAGEPEGAVFIAEEQTAGRGRGDHTWHSARSSGIYCSVVLRPALAPAEVLVLSLAAGLAVYSAVDSVLAAHPPSRPVSIDLRWPNDALANGRKFVGILTELAAEATRVRHVVVGVGLNVNHQSFPAELRDIATSLRLETGREWSRVELAAALLKSLDREYRELAGGGDCAALIRRFEQRSSAARGCRVRIEEDGYEGITRGLDARGFLQVETPQGLRTVLSGTVRAIAG